MTKTRRLEVKEMIEERARLMHMNMREPKPRVYAKETVIAVIVVVFLWYAFMCTQLLDVVMLVSSI